LRCEIVIHRLVLLGASYHNRAARQSGTARPDPKAFHFPRRQIGNRAPAFNTGSSAPHYQPHDRAASPDFHQEIAMRLVSALAPLALITGLAMSSSAFADSTISIEGKGEVTATPDTAFVTSGVTTQGTTAREALDANTKAMAELIATLKAAGIADRDIQTSGFSVNPNYVYSDARDANGYTLPPKIVGYQVANTVSVRVRALDSLGSVLDRAVTVGANTINGVSFAVADPSALYNEARKLAFADARAKAQLYATAAGTELGDIRTITEAQSYSQPQPMMMRQMADVAAAAPVPVQAGELSFAINVQVSWELEQ
jgi:uncharacterized protein YggE